MSARIGEVSPRTINALVIIDNRLTAGRPKRVCTRIFSGLVEPAPFASACHEFVESEKEINLTNFLAHLRQRKLLNCAKTVESLMKGAA